MCIRVSRIALFKRAKQEKQPNVQKSFFFTCNQSPNKVTYEEVLKNKTQKQPHKKSGLYTSIFNKPWHRNFCNCCELGSACHLPCGHYPRAAASTTGAEGLRGCGEARRPSAQTAKFLNTSLKLAVT